MDKLFQNKWAIRVMSLIFAVSLYLYVNIEADTTTKTDNSVIPGASTEVKVLDDVPLDVKLDAEQYVVSGVPNEVTVSLEGKTSILTPTVRQRNFKLFVDLRNLSEGEHTVDIEYKDIPKDLKVYIEPKSIDVVIEKRATREFKVDIDVVNADKLPLGYELGEFEVNPETVTIVSSETVIDQIAMVKAFVDVTDLKESIHNREVPISVYNIQGNDLSVKVEPESVAISVQVDRPSKKVPLNIETKGDLPEGLELEEIKAEEEIEIFGKREILQNIESISTKEIDLSKIEKSGEQEVELDFPEGVIANNETVTVDIALNSIKEFEDITIDIEGQPNDDVVFINPDEASVNVEATGLIDTISELKKSEIKASINLSGMTAGEHDVSLEVTGPEGITLEPAMNEVKVEIGESE